MVAPVIDVGSDVLRPVTLYLVRHGAVDEAVGRCIGHCDVPLSSKGRDDIVRLAGSWHAPEHTRVVASNLARARDSAAALTRSWRPTVEIETDARLREMSFGAWDGRPWADIERDDAARLGRWMARWQSARTPRGESFGDVIGRVADWLDDAVRQLRATHADARVDAHVDAHVDALVVVAHAGSIRSLLVHTIGLPRALAFRLRLDHARVSAVRIAGDVSRQRCEQAELLFLNADRVPGDGAPAL